MMAAMRVLGEDFRSRLVAGTAACCDAEFIGQIHHGRRAPGGGLTDLLVRDCVADADVHDSIAVQLNLATLKVKMRMIVNSITYKPRHDAVLHKFSQQHLVGKSEIGWTCNIFLFRQS